MRHCEVIIPEFSTRLRSALKRKRMSQRMLARRLEVDKKTVNCWCNDLYFPNLGYLRRICEILDVSADWLLELKEQN